MTRKIIGSLSVIGEYKPGDPPPAGYNDWHEWAAVQHKAGLHQVCCNKCSKWKYLQEIAETKQEKQIAYKSKRDAMNETNSIETLVNVVVCNDCHHA